MAARPLLLLLLSSSVRASWSSSNIKQDQVTIRTPQAPDEVNREYKLEVNDSRSIVLIRGATFYQYS